MDRAWVTSSSYRLMIETLVAVRGEVGVGQRELARRLGKHPSWLNKIERLERRLDVLELVAIARGLGLTPSDLISRLSARLPQEIVL